MTHPRPYSAADDAWLCEHYTDASVDELRARFPERTLKALRAHAHLLGLKRSPEALAKNCAAWADWERDKLCRLYALGLTVDDIAKVLGRSPAAVHTQCSLIGLRRTEDMRSYPPSGACGPKPKRKCHDCGRPTDDYRCPVCLRKWRQKNGVSESAYGIDEYHFGG